MLKFFADDSGSHTNSDGFFVLYGYIMEEQRWEDFSERWDAQLHRTDFFPIPYCRMADAWNGDGPFAGINDVFRRRKAQDLAEVVSHCHPAAVGCRMPWEMYNRIVRGKVVPEVDNPYAVLFFSILRGIALLQEQIVENMTPEMKEEAFRDYGAVIEIKPVDFIFDHQGEAGNNCLAWYAGLQKRLTGPHRVILSNTPQFKDDREVLPLQAADMLAWHVRRQWENHLEDHSDMLELLQPFGVLECQIDEGVLMRFAQLYKAP